MGRKADAITTNQRVNRICEMLVRCYRSREIVQHAADTWGLKERQARQLIAKARARLVEDAHIDRQEMLSARIQTLELIARKHMDTNPAAAVGALKLLDSLIGLGVQTRTPDQQPQRFQ